MRKNNSVNSKIMKSISSNNTNKYNNIMNSSNYGKQQIILQSCCFFDYEKSQTPHAIHKTINFDINNQKLLNSARVTSSSKGTSAVSKSDFVLFKSSKSLFNASLSDIASSLSFFALSRAAFAASSFA